MFALYKSGLYFSQNFTWHEVTNDDFSQIMQFGSQEGAQNFLKEMFNDKMRADMEIIDLDSPIKPLVVKLHNPKPELTVVTKYVIVHNGYGKFYGKMFTWTTAFSYAMQFDTLEEARQVIKETLGNVPRDLLEIRQLTLSKIEEKEPTVINNLTAEVITTTVNADAEIYRAAIALVCINYGEEEAIETAERVWLKVKHDHRSS